jgi:hypothetical protein
MIISVKMFRNTVIGIMTLLPVLFCNCYSQNNKAILVDSWVTSPERSSLFQKQTDIVFFSSSSRGSGTPIIIDETQQYQSIGGFGFALTGGSRDICVAWGEIRINNMVVITIC